MLTFSCSHSYRSHLKTSPPHKEEGMVTIEYLHVCANSAILIQMHLYDVSLASIKTCTMFRYSIGLVRVETADLA